MKKIFLVVFSLGTGVFLVFWLYQKVGVNEALIALNILQGWQILILFLLSVVGIFIWIIRWKIILQTLEKKKFPYPPLIEARVGERAISYLTPGIHYGGEVVRILIFKDKQTVSAEQVTTSVILDRITEISGMCLFSFLAASVLVFEGNYAWASFLTGFAIFILLILLFIFKFVGFRAITHFVTRFIPKKRTWSGQRRMNQLKYKIRLVGKKINSLFRKSPRLFYQATVLSCLFFLVGALEMWLFIIFLGGRFSFAYTLPMRVVIAFAGLIPISASLGVYEGANVLAFSAFGLGAGMGLGYSLVQRLIDFVVVLIGISFVLRHWTANLVRRRSFSILNHHQMRLFKNDD